MLRVNGNFINRNFNAGANFNAVLDCSFSDVGTSSAGGAQLFNFTGTGLTFTKTELIGATIYLLFVDGLQYKKVTSLSDPAAKEFTFDSTTGLLSFSIILSATDVTVFYTSPATASLPATEPVTLQQVKDFCKIDTTEDDGIIEMLITTAREQIEDYTGISIITRTVTAVLNNSCGNIYLPYCPFVELVSIEDGEGETIETGNYTLSGMLFPQLIEPADNRIKIVYTAGYGIPPQRIKSAILQQVFYLYQNRGESTSELKSGIVVDINLSPQAKATLQRLRRV